MPIVVAAPRRIVFVVMGILGLAACATTPEVSTHVPDGVHLERYKTYFLRSGSIDDLNSVKPGNQTEVGQALEADIREELQSRGLKPQDLNADLTFSYAAAKRLQHWGQGKWPYHEGGLDIAATDSTGRVVWNSHLQAMIDPKDKTHHHLKEAIGRAFKNYPSVNP